MLKLVYNADAVQPSKRHNLFKPERPDEVLQEISGKTQTQEYIPQGSAQKNE